MIALDRHAGTGGVCRDVIDRDSRKVEGIGRCEMGSIDLACDWRKVPVYNYQRVQMSKSEARVQQ